MAKIFFYMATQDHAIYHVWIHFIPTSLYLRGEKTIWSELESNPDPLASQATTLTTRPRLLGQIKFKLMIGMNLNQSNFKRRRRFWFSRVSTKFGRFRFRFRSFFNFCDISIWTVTYDRNKNTNALAADGTDSVFLTVLVNYKSNILTTGTEPPTTDLLKESREAS